MTDVVYFLNDFQKTTIKNTFKQLKMSFNDGDDRTYVIVDHPNLSEDMSIVASSASWVCKNPQYDSSKHVYKFVEHSLEDIAENINFSIKHWELLD